MKRLEKLKLEQLIAKNLVMLPFQLRPLVENYYGREIAAIEEYGEENSEVSEDSVNEIKKIVRDLDGVKEA
jgi:hypothetical protein